MRYHSSHIFISILLIFGWNAFACAQDFVKAANDRVDGHQKRIDLYDNIADNQCELLLPEQTKNATNLYFLKVNTVQKNINNNPNYSALEKKRVLTDLSNLLERIDRSNYFMYTSYSRYFEMILKVQEIVETNRMVAILKSDLITAMNVIPFYDTKPYASQILQLAAQIHPSELLKHFDDFAHTDYALTVLDKIAQHAPMHLSFYMGSANKVFLIMSSEEAPKHIAYMMEIYNKVGSNSKAFMLMDDIVNYRITIQEAHRLTRSRAELFPHLIHLRHKQDLLADYSVDDELTYQCRLKVREINELHEETDEIRFQLVDTIPYSAEDLYSLMVYGEDEVYTSSFLGLYQRMMDRMTEPSSYQFLHNLGMNHYRTFIKMCAAYNTLPNFLNKMSEWERRALFNRFVTGLQNEINPLEQAVAVADTYGSIKDETSKKQFELALKKAYEAIRWNNKEAEKLYALLLQIFKINTLSADLQDNIGNMATIPNALLFKNAEHIQQHFFFDDEDGWASYATFIATFHRIGWKIIDKGTYVIIESTAGKKVKIYANKAKDEYAGQDDLAALFKLNKRYPDVVVHRGHS
ncbi:MAG: hypothetical protein ACI83I_001703, partial [Bacteroidia bacterium]